MLDLIHLFFGIALGLIIIGGFIAYLFGKLFYPPGENVLPDQKNRINPEDIAQENSGQQESRDHKGPDRFEQELDEIYRQLEGPAPLEVPKEERPPAEEEEREKEMEEEEIGELKTEKDTRPDRPKYQEIYQAFDAGETVTDLARNFRKNKGEIELILNLRGRDDREEEAI